jgi:hypothetical protein
VRFNDWPERLAEFIASRRQEPFAYGTHDCCQFAAAAVEAMTGENPAAAWQYSNELGAARLIIETGGIDKLVSEAMGGPVHPSQAGRGDVVLAELDRGPTIGVCLGRDCAFPADVGVTFRHRSVATQAWKVR